MTDVPPGPPGASNLPARRLSSQELEAVIRRAVELQAATGAVDDGIAEGEVMRIGQELGLDAASVRRAIVDVRGRPPEERGLVARVMGPGAARAVRTIRRPASEVGLLVEEYLLRCEYMVVQRRFADRTRYEKDRGLSASMGRMTRRMASGPKLLELEKLDVGVSALDADTALVELSVDMAGARVGWAGAGAGVGAASGGTLAAFALATPIVDPLALLAVPIFTGAVAAVRGMYGATRGSTQEKLEAFLDRLEHGEVKVPGRGGPGGGGDGGFTIGPPGFGIRIGPGGRRR